MPEFRADDLPVEIVLPRLCRVRRTGGGREWVALCPAHDDTCPSLSIREAGDLRALVHCHAGCTFADICAALGLQPRHLYPCALALLRAREAGRTPVTYAPRCAAAVDPDEPLPEHDYRAWDRMALGFELAAKPKIGEFAASLGVSVESLHALGYGWDHDREYWTVPERDNRFRVVGIATRAPNGAKGAVVDSHRGLSLPSKLWARDPARPVYVTEGASDAAALLTAGRCALARPGLRLSPLTTAWLVALLGAREPAGREIVIVADNTERERAGAVKLRDALAALLSVGVHVARPADGSKDVREMLNRQGTIDLMTHTEEDGHGTRSKAPAARVRGER